MHRLRLFKKLNRHKEKYLAQFGRQLINNKDYIWGKGGIHPFVADKFQQFIDTSDSVPDIIETSLDCLFHQESQYERHAAILLQGKLYQLLLIARTDQLQQILEEQCQDLLAYCLSAQEMEV